ncbi:MAG: isocitrate lyase/phosphoenolpyruvate mutase family protein [Labilithrix sp.]|nr:isocitrate lyase/phosphoenolpyruvate mutase family protein [Labilithrix sp.]MCW5813994.1 isocitrate lyase/phosphoenolpyruvate mutase family protein [Labilithrix sp.]
MSSIADKRARFRALHAEGCFVIPNPWDVGSARVLQHLGFAALATTSSGFAWSTGRPDYGVARDDVLAHVGAIAAAVDVPVNADFESGFAAEPEDVAANVTLAVATGIAGLSIEDTDVRVAGRLYPKALAAERVGAARAAIDAADAAVVLVGRTEGLLADPTAVSAATSKLVALAEAGADCLYAPGVWSKDDIAAMVRAVAPKPLNVLAQNPALTLADYAALGVRRVSVGGALARVAWGAVRAAAEEMKKGSFASLSTAMPGKDLNGIFRR